MMRLTEDQYEVIRPLLPVQRGNVRIANSRSSTRCCMSPRTAEMARAAGALRQLAHHLHALAAVGGGGGAGPAFPGFTRTSPYLHSRRVRRLGQHQREGASRWHWRFKKNGPQAIGKSRGGWNTKIHMVAADARTAIVFALSPGHEHDAPHGRDLLEELGPGRRDFPC